MKVSGHVVVTLGISSIIYVVFHSGYAFFSSMIGGVLIDLDHVIDYYLHKGINFRLRKFFQWCYENKWEKLFLFFHSLELILFLWIIINVFELGIIWIGFAVGLTQHMLLDVIFNKQMKVYSYFFIYRWMHGFKKEYIKRDIQFLD